MAWYAYLWPFGRKRKNRRQEEAVVSEEFRTQLKEALLSQEDLQAAANKLRQDRADRTLRYSLPPYRQTLPSE